MRVPELKREGRAFWEYHSKLAWKACSSVPRYMSRSTKEKSDSMSRGKKVEIGCIGFLFFGFLWWFLPALLTLAVFLVLVVYASLVSLVWGAVTLFGRRNSEKNPL